MEPMNPMMGGADPREKKMPMFWLAVVAAAALAVATAYALYYGAPSGPAAEDATTSELKTQGTSDEITAIEQDLGATSLDALDRELGDIEAKLGQ